MSTPLEEAPFNIYLQILRENGHEEDADASEAFYIDVLTNVTNKDGEAFTVEQVMRTPFKNLVAAVEKIVEAAATEIQKAIPREPVIPLTGKVLTGKGADKLSSEQLTYLAMRQAQLFEEEKIRQAMR